MDLLGVFLAICHLIKFAINSSDALMCMDANAQNLFPDRGTALSGLLLQS